MIESLEKNLKNHGKTFQLSVLRLLIEDRKFANKINPILNSEYFDNKYIKWFSEVIGEFIVKYKTSPDKEYLERIIIERIEGDSSKELYLSTLKTIFETSLEKISYIQEEIFNFCNLRKILIELEKAKDLALAGDFDASRDASKKAYSNNTGAIERFDLKKDYKLALSDEVHFPIGCPFPSLNTHSKGGPGRGHLALVMTPSNFGKTAFLTAWARYASTVEKKNVLFISLETECIQIIQRFLAGLIRTNQEDLKLKEDEITKKVESFDSNLRFVRFKSKSFSCETLQNEIDDCKADGFFPELVVIDYLQLMKVTKGTKVSVEKDNGKIEIICEELRDISGEEQILVASAIQSNRCLGLYTLVDSKNGKKFIKDLTVGEEILTHKGFKKVTKIYPIEKQTTYKIKTKSGKEIICSEKHLFPTDNGLISIEEGLKIGNKLFVNDMHDFYTVPFLDEIESIELMGENETIDITVEDTHMFYANDIYTHNSGFKEQYATEDAISKAIESLWVSDWFLAFTQQPEDAVKSECYGTLMKNRLGPKGLIIKAFYDPNQGIFEELELLNRNVLLMKKNPEQIRQGINTAQKFLENKKLKSELG